MKRSPKSKQKKQPNNIFTLNDPVDISFAAHLSELRRRIYTIVILLIGLTAGAYFIQQSLVSILLKPAHHVQFIYTSPGGGIGFLFNVCLYFAIAVCIPVIIYEAFSFIRPALKYTTRRDIVWYSVLSGSLAAVGICFGYFLGLPTALHFLTNQFTTSQIHPLFTLSEYLSFITFYLLGSALLFQIPLIILLINKNKPLKPRKLLSLEKYVVLGAFVISAVMAPSINLINQLVLAVPIILMYNLSVLVVWNLNRHIRYKNDHSYKQLIKNDEAVRDGRKKQSMAVKIKQVMENIQNPKRKRILVKILD